MSEVTDIVVPLLQRIQAEVTRMSADMANMKQDLHNIKIRMTGVEENFGAMNRRMASSTGGWSASNAGLT
ncbi:hypothetical protein [Phenylobacterium sp.]|uniref:hypothetical protein n=1 Tax=Phenylobacterium sp. TaxID=1871053 RepID=UPI00286D1C96|nr:hypothetical protein [Phenylobacterium sp.]